MPFFTSRLLIPLSFGPINSNCEVDEEKFSVLLSLPLRRIHSTWAGKKPPDRLDNTHFLGELKIEFSIHLKRASEAAEKRKKNPLLKRHFEYIYVGLKGGREKEVNAKRHFKKRVKFAR
jgi:hypothetical protein